MIDGQFAYAFTVGMVATVNPCGFAMLPAYLSFFLGIEGEQDDSTSGSLSRALAVSAAVTAGFLIVFVTIGALVNAGLSQVIDLAKYASIVIGVGLVILGIAMLFGYRLPFTTPRLDRGGRDRTVRSMFVFGVSYAIASIGCSLPLFLGVSFNAITREGFASGVLSFVFYGLGMGLLLTALTVTLALARGGLLRVLRHAMRYVDQLAGAFLVLAGVYLVYYWVFNLRFDSTGSLTGGGVAHTVEGWSADTAEWIQDRGVWTMAVVLGAIVIGAALIAGSRRRHRISR